MDSMKNYGDIEYWDERYLKDPEPFEWYQSYSGIRHLLEKLNRSIIPGNDAGTAVKSLFPSKEKCNVLIIGCGNSPLGGDMMKDGWAGGITNVDFSETVIKQMKERYNDALYRKIQSVQNRRCHENDKFPKLEKDNEKNKPKKMRPIRKMVFEYADVTEFLPFSDESFDLIMCKGTLDSILCSKGGILKTQHMMKECHRVLKKDYGILFTVSFGTPDNRLIYFENTRLWRQVDVHKVPKRRVGNFADGSNNSKYHYVYIVRTRNDLNK